ncbi:FadR/GntR family transcriptional regulator [Pseudonocardia hispaniensis]|uniref:FadR/GntR family transcriptional regulator n=1 Tax=Pseudonocardia hispaniensis TaxID=904933 RepID=A0ABW1J7D2_9PSEU
MSEPKFTQLTPQPLWTAAVDQLRELIDTGAIPPGTRLPGERTLCAQLGISRVSLREALRVLQAIGYVETRPGAGTFARVPDPVEPEQAATWFENDLHVVELFELRMLVEPGAAALAAARRVEDDVARMRFAIDQMRDAAARSDRLATVAADAEFHRVVGASLGNDAVKSLVEFMQERSGVERRVSLSVPGQIERAINGHLAILEAIAAKDAEAARLAMLHHLEDAMRFLRQHTEQHRTDKHHEQRRQR